MTLVGLSLHMESILYRISMIKFFEFYWFWMKSYDLAALFAYKYAEWKFLSFESCVLSESKHEVVRMANIRDSFERLIVRLAAHASHQQRTVAYLNRLPRSLPAAYSTLKGLVFRTNRLIISSSKALTDQAIGDVPRLNSQWPTRIRAWKAFVACILKFGAQTQVQLPIFNDTLVSESLVNGQLLRMIFKSILLIQ